jgi:hypothetical protein
MGYKYRFSVGDLVIANQGGLTFLGKIKHISNYGSWNEANFKFEVELEHSTVNIFGWALKPVSEKNISDEIKFLFLKEKFKQIAKTIKGYYDYSKHC